MGNFCDCFGTERPILPVHSPPPSKIIELQKIDIGKYGITITVWQGNINGLYDVRFNFYSKSEDDNCILWKVLNYHCVKVLRQTLPPINQKNQVMIYLNNYQLMCLKEEYTKIENVKVIWRNFA
jgi:hypothetical protein